MGMSYKIYKELDLTSTGCSGPMGELAQVVDDLQPGEAVKVRIGSDSKDMLANFAKLRGLKVEEVKNDGKVAELLVIKG